MRKAKSTLRFDKNLRVFPKSLIPIGVCLAALSIHHSTVSAQTVNSNSELNRALSEYMFFSARLGAAHRQAVFFDENVPSANSSDEFRLRVSGAMEDLGKLGGYFGLTVVQRPLLDSTDNVASPFADPYDRFSPSRNIRLHSAHLEYRVKDDEQRESFRFRAGRIATLDNNGQLLLCDGISLRLAPSQSLAISASGGIRGRLDDELTYRDRGLPQQVCAGSEIRWQQDDWYASASYRYEQVHRNRVSGGYLNENWSAQIGLELMNYEDDSQELSDPVFIVDVDGGFLSDDQRWASDWYVYAQLGVDPRSFGRADFTLNPQVPGTLSANRLYFGAADPHIRARLDNHYWFGRSFALQGGGFARFMLNNEDQDSMRPQLLEAWIGPEFMQSRGYRAGVELQVSTEEAGEESIFRNTGDQVDRRIGWQAYGEIPLRPSDSLAIALRPHVRATWINTQSILADADNQLRISGGLLSTLVWQKRGKIAVHYELENLPEFGSDGTRTVHRAELWIEGTYQ